MLNISSLLKKKELLFSDDFEGAESAIPLLSAAFSVTSLTQEITAFEMALFLASIAPAALAGAVSSLVRPRAAPVPRAPEAPATEERVDEAPASEAGASD